MIQQVPASRTHSLGGRLLDHASRTPDAPAVTTDSGTTTYADLARDATQTAAALLASGVQPGDRIAVLARNCVEYIELTYAASIAGVTLVGLNFRLAPREIADIIDDSRPSLLFFEEELRPLLSETPDLPSTIRLTPGEDSSDYGRWRALGTSDLAPSGENDADAVILQMYTAGTTGRSKGVMLLERNVDAMLAEMSRLWLMEPDMRCLAVLPLFHVSGTGIVFAPLYAGGEVVLPRDVSSSLILSEISQRRVTHSALVPSLISLVLADPASRTSDLSSLRVLVYGAAPSAGTTIEEAMELMPECLFFHGYGLTETCGGVAIAPPHKFGDHDDKKGTVGHAVANYEFRIVDPNTLQDVPAGQDGEVWARGPQNTSGYWNRPAETAQLLVGDGWVRTGDVGALDEDGFLYLRDRIKDMIISGGENVYSAEVENVLAQHPAVLEAAVYGVPDEKWGEVVKAAVTLREGYQMTASELIDFSRDRLAHFKCPKVVDIVDELPKSGSGKILKRELRLREAAGAAT